MPVALSRQVCLLPSLPSCALPSVSCRKKKNKGEKPLADRSFQTCTDAFCRQMFSYLLMSREVLGLG